MSLKMHNPSGHDIVRITQIVHLNLCSIIVLWISSSRLSLCTPDCCFDDAMRLSLTIASPHPCAPTELPCSLELLSLSHRRRGQQLPRKYRRCQPQRFVKNTVLTLPSHSH